MGPDPPEGVVSESDWVKTKCIPDLHLQPIETGVCCR